MCVGSEIMIEQMTLYPAKKFERRNRMKASEMKIDLTNERKQFAVMIGIYLGCYGDFDSFKTIDKIIKFANEYDFEMEKDGYIDTELAREAAEKYAYELSISERR